MSFKHALILTCFALLLRSLPAQVDATSRLSPQLQDELLQNGQAEYLVRYIAEANLGGAAAITTISARRQFVYDRLRQQALRSQAEAVQLLKGSGASFRRHYLLNALEVKSDLALAQQLSMLPGVDRLSGLRAVRNELPQPTPGAARDRP